MKLSNTHLSTLLTVLLASPSVVTALQHSHHAQEGRHARAHDGVLARRVVKQEMQAREEHWVGERQLIPILGDDGEEDESTSASRRPTTSAAVVPTTSAAPVVPTTSAADVPPTTSAAVRTTSAAVVTPPTSSINTPIVSSTAPTVPASTSVVVVSETESTTSQGVDVSTGLASSSGTSTAVGASGTGALSAPTGMTSSTPVVSATANATSQTRATITTTDPSLTRMVTSTSSRIPPLSAVISEDESSRVSTNAEGSVVFVTEVQTLSRSSQSGIISDQTATVLETMSAGNSNSTSNAKGEDESGGGLSTGAIVGISVVAGVVFLGLVLFLIWKLKQKRFASFDDDDADGIKWPELNRHGDSAMNLPLPAKPTGGHGFETNAFERGRTDLDGNLIDDDYETYSHNPVSLAGSMHDASPYYHDPSPPLPGSSMSYADTGVYGQGGAGVTRNPSTGASTFLSSHNDDMAYNLGGSRAFDSRPDSEMMEMTETRTGGLGRSGSGRLL